MNFRMAPTSASTQSCIWIELISLVMEIGAPLTPDVAEVRDPVDVVHEVADERRSNSAVPVAK